MTKQQVGRYIVKALSDKADDGGLELSLGRISFLAVFVSCMICWVGGKDVPSTQLTTLMLLVGYIFGSKVSVITSKLISGKRDDEDSDEPAPRV
jgi:hypothetical protein